MPWERRGPTSQTWLALLIARKDTEAKLTTGPLKNAVGASTLGALQALEPVADPNEPVSVMTFSDVNVLSSILPTAAELDLLCHVRRVNVADTALDLGDDDGWFAVVTANRLPQGSADGIDYLACLVSLEGRSDITSLPAPGTTPPAPAPPLIALASWEFTSLDAGGTFEHLAASLDVAAFAAAAPAGADGTATLEHTARDGAVASGTYRGPLLGTTPATAAPLPATGDVSLPAAFELGRLLGAADGRFTREIVDWHRTIDAEAQTQASAAVVGEAIGEEPRALRATAAPAHVAIGARLLSRAAAAHPAADRWGVHPAARELLTRSAPTDGALDALAEARRAIISGVER